MSEDQDARQLLDRAEHAAMAGDFASADGLLKSAARMQEEELGPLHPDLANTLNNLAVVAEKLGRASEAETLYRRAAAIATAALPSDHPMVVASRQNLEDFCHARGLPIDVPPIITPPRDTKLAADVVAADRLTEVAEPPTAARPADIIAKAAPRPSIPFQPLPRAPTPGSALPARAWLAIGLVVLVAAALLLTRPWSSHDVSTTVQTPAPAQPTEAVSPPVEAPPATPAPIGGAGRPKAAPRGGDRNVNTNKPPAAGIVTMATAQLCRNFSTSGASWRCDPVGSSVAPGQIVLYTRVRSPRDTTVIHRWYRGDALRQSVSLTIRANATEGYRTYSRQSVDGGDWRVEVRSPDGTVLHEQRFKVH